MVFLLENTLLLLYYDILWYVFFWTWLKYLDPFLVLVYLTILPLVSLHSAY